MKGNQHINKLIEELKKLAIEQEVNLWKRIAGDLEKPTRQRHVVNIYKLEQHTGKDETVIVAGKVLGTGELTHPIKVAALTFSEEAKQKITANKGIALSIHDLMKENPKGSKIKILG